MNRVSIYLKAEMPLRRLKPFLQGLRKSPSVKFKLEIRVPGGTKDDVHRILSSICPKLEKG